MHAMKDMPMKNILALVALALAAPLALAHAALQGSTPADGAIVTPAPTELRLRYGEPVEAALSSVRLLGPGDAAIATAPPAADPADKRTLVLRLPGLAPGTYRAQWATVGHDGHRTKGEIRFTVK
jgi:methionine-rich copper-binding protein CopC